MEEYTLGMNYRYHFNTHKRIGKGELYVRDGDGDRDRFTKITDVLVVKVTDPSQYEPLKYSHVNLLKCVQVNVLNDADVRLIFELPRHHSHPLSTVGTERIVASYEIPCPPSDHSVSTCGLTPHARSILKQLYKVVLYLHSLDLCLMPFDINDIWIFREPDIYGQGDFLKIVGVGIFSNKSQEAKRSDWINVINVITSLVASRVVHTVEDLIYQTSKVEVRAERLEKNILCHLAFCPPSETLKFITKCGDNLNPKQHIDHPNNIVLEKVANFPCRNWQEAFTNLPAYSYITAVYSHNASSYVTNEKSLSAKASILKFGRNLIQHLKLDVSDLEMEMIILSLFHDQILTAHSALHENNHFSTIMSAGPR